MRGLIPLLRKGKALIIRNFSAYPQLKTAHSRRYMYYIHSSHTTWSMPATIESRQPKASDFYGWLLTDEPITLSDGGTVLTFVLLSSTQRALIKQFNNN